MSLRRPLRLVTVSLVATALLAAGSPPALAAEEANNCKVSTQYDSKLGRRAVIECFYLRIGWEARAELVVTGPLPNKYTVWVDEYRSAGSSGQKRGVVAVSDWSKNGEYAVRHYRNTLA